MPDSAPSPMQRKRDIQPDVDLGARVRRLATLAGRVPPAWAPHAAQAIDRLEQILTAAVQPASELAAPSDEDLVVDELPVDELEAPAGVVIGGRRA